MPNGKKTKTLSLCEKLQLIEEYEVKKISARELAVLYGVGKTQVYDTLKNKTKIKAELMSGTSGQRKRLYYAPVYEDVNKTMWEWFRKRHEKGLPVSGPMLQAHALKVAQELGHHRFKASNGWLDSFKARHKIVCSMNGKEVRILEKDVIVIIEEPPKQTLLDFTAGYSEDNIFVAFETSLCYKALSASSDCSDRVGVLLCMSMNGTLFKPMVVGKFARPKVFGKLDVLSLPVHWRSSAHACMTNFLLEEWLSLFNESMAAEEREVVLFLNVQSCHSNSTFTNVKVAQSPEAMDTGILQYFKGLYRKSLLQTILMKSSCEVEKDNSVKVEASEVGELCSSISLLDAVSWISRAVSNIPPKLVRRSLVASGFAPQDGVVVPIDDAESSLRADIYDLCQRLSVDPEEVLSFEDECPQVPLLIKEEPIEPMQEEEQLHLRTFSEALKAVNDLEKFAAHSNSPQLLSLLQDAKEVLSQSCLDG